MNGGPGQLADILDSISDGFFSLDNDLRVVFFNRSAEKLLGRKREDVVGRQFFEAFPEIKGSIFEEKYVLSVNKKIALAFETHFEIEPYAAWYQVSVYPYADGISVYFQIITERKRLEAERLEAEAALRASEKKYRLIVEETDDLITSVDKEGKLIFLNHVAEKVFGCGLEGCKKCIGVSAFDFVFPDDRERTKKWFEECAAKKIKQSQIENRQLNSVTGEIRDLLWACSFTYDEQGRVAVVDSIGHDITDRKLLEIELQGRRNNLEALVKSRTEELARSEKLFRTYFQIGSIGMAITSPDKYWLHVNDRLCEILGYSREELTQKTWAELTHPEDLDTDVIQFNQVLAGEIDSYSMDKRFFRKDGKIVWTTLFVSCSRKEDRSVEYFIAHLQDITARTAAEAKLDEQRKYLSALDKINKIVSSTTDIDQSLGLVLKEVLSIFDCDRAWFLFPCNPKAPSWSVPMEVTRPEYPGALALNEDIPMTPDAADVLRIALETSGPVIFDQTTGRHIPTGEQFNTKAQIIRAIYPKIGEPWVFGIHHCSSFRNWKKQEINLFNEIALRITDSMSSLFLLRDLRVKTKEYESIIRTTRDGFWLVDAGGNFLDVNNAYCELSGYCRDELLTMKIPDVEAVENNDEIAEHIGKIISAGWDIFETKHKTKSGELFAVEVSATYTPDGKFVAFIRDISERKKTEQQLKNYAETQRVLVQEINHRVKNNLTAILGLLHQEQGKLDEIAAPQCKAILENMDGRIRGLATVHSMLSAVDWQALPLKNLCEKIIVSIAGGREKPAAAEIIVSTADAMVSSDQAHHLTLVINELTANSLKHAAVKGKRLTIKVDASQTGNMIEMRYRDNGPGFPVEFINGDYGKAGTGINLIRGVVARNLSGRVEFKNDNGAETIIYFPKEREE